MTDDLSPVTRRVAPPFRLSAEDNLMTIREVAANCRVSPKTVSRWIEARQLAASKLGGQWRVARNDLELFVRQRWQAPA
jgi:excisionase family DNA binding protein